MEILRTRRLPVAPWRYRHPPNGLTEEWRRIHHNLTGPVITVYNLQRLAANWGTAQATPDLFPAWLDTLRRSEAAAQAVVDPLHGRSYKTWTVGNKILEAIAPVRCALTDPSPPGQTLEVTAWQANVAKKLSEFDAEPLLVELDAAVVADCAMQLAGPIMAALPAPVPEPTDALTAPPRQESTAPTARASEDGPQTHGFFYFERKPHKFGALQWRLLSAVWDKDSVSFETIGNEVYPGEDEIEGKLKKLVSDTNDKLLRERLPFEIVSPMPGHYILQKLPSVTSGVTET